MDENSKAKVNNFWQIETLPKNPRNTVEEPESAELCWVGAPVLRAEVIQFLQGAASRPGVLQLIGEVRKTGKDVQAAELPSRAATPDQQAVK